MGIFIQRIEFKTYLSFYNSIQC